MNVSGQGSERDTAETEGPIENTRSKSRDEESEELETVEDTEVVADAGAVEAADMRLDRDTFMRDILRELSGTLQDVVGLEEASGFISVVGQRLGRRIDEAYRARLKVDQLSSDQAAEVMVDLKRRIEGDFYVIEASEEKIVLGNRACPFGDKVAGRPALCMMTSNVFGSIAADNLGYAKVELQETIAQGNPGCRVVIHLQPTGEAEGVSGREYFRTRDEG